MIDLEAALHELADRVDYPDPPDLSASVMRAITTSAPTRTIPRTARIGIALATIVVVVALIPAARDRVAAWLGLRGVTIVETPLEWTGHIELGEAMTLAEATQQAGFEPLIPLSLGQPDAAFVENDRIWLVYAPRGDLPETSLPGIGAVVTQFTTDDAPGIVKRAGGDTSAEFVEFDANFGVWIEGPHDLVLISPSENGATGRQADNTFLFETEMLTIRIEIAGSLPTAMEIARSMR